MKIAHVLPSNDVGGINIQTIRLISEFSEHDHRVIVPDEEGRLPELLTDEVSQPVSCKYGLPKYPKGLCSIVHDGRWILGSPYWVYDTYSALDELDPDIVHIYGLLLIHPGIAGYMTSAATVWYLVSDIYPQKLVDAVMPIVKTIADEIMLISEANRDYYNLNDRNVTIAPGFVDPTEFNLDRYTDDDIGELRDEFGVGDRFTVCTVGRVTDIKNQIAGVEAMSHIEHPPEYLIVGDTSDQEYLDEIKQLSDEYGVSESVQVLGYVDDIRDIYAVADVFLLPSVAEGTPLTIMEATAMGVPVIASDVGGVKEMLDRGEAGTLVDPECPEEIARAIEYYRKESNAEEHVTRAKQILHERYTIESVRQKYSTAYRQAIKNK